LKYILTRQVLECDVELEISRARFETTKAAKENLVVALGPEEKYDIAIENYYEYESELLNQALRGAMFPYHSWSIGNIQAFSKRLMNMLAACRLYLDSVRHDLNLMCRDGGHKAENFREQISEEYDASMGYRAMDALRNYVQHRALPISSLEYSSKRESPSHDKYFVVIPYVNLRRLELDRKFKRDILDELKGLGDRIDIRPLVREYILAIGRLHNTYRQLVSQDLEAWEYTISGVGEEYRKRSGDEETVGLAVIAIDDCDQYVESIPVFVGMIERRRLLEKKNQLVDFTKVVITNQVSSSA